MNIEGIGTHDGSGEVATDKLTKLLTSDPEVRFAFRALELASAKYESDPENAKALIQRDEALQRYVGILKKFVGTERNCFTESLAKATEIISSDAAPQAKDFLTQSLLLIGAAVLASASAGAIGALLVKEVVWKEIVKSAVGAFITTMVTLKVEHGRRKPPTAN
jgi:hypothetical protein